MSDPIHELQEPATLAGDLGFAPAPAWVEIGLTFLPLALRRPPTGLCHCGAAEICLAAWLEAVDGAAARGRARLSALASWRERAAKSLKGTHGRGARTLADLFLARPVLSASVVADELGFTGTRSCDLLNAVERRGLVREMTGQRKFRHWLPQL